MALNLDAGAPGAVDALGAGDKSGVPYGADEIDRVVEQVIDRYRSNSKDIMRLALETIVALTASEARVRELAEQGFLARAFRTVIGSNDRLRDSIDANLVVSQYAAVRLLQRLVEQNMLNLKLASAVNRKLDKLALNIDPELLHDLAQLAGLYEQVSCEIAALEARIARLERLLE